MIRISWGGLLEGEMISSTMLSSLEPVRALQEPLKNPSPLGNWVRILAPFS